MPRRLAQGGGPSVSRHKIKISKNRQDEVRWCEQDGDSGTFKVDAEGIWRAEGEERDEKELGGVGGERRVGMV